MSFSHGTATDAALSATGTDKQRLHLDPKEFRMELGELAKEVKALVHIARKVGKNNKIVVKGGEEVGPKQLNAMVADHNRRLKQLSKNYSARGRRKRGVASTRVRREGAGFDAPVFLRQPLIDFLRAADFGLTPDGQRVNDVLAPFLESGILNRSTLTPLIVIYSHTKLRDVEQGVDKNGKAKEKIFYHVDPVMQKYLGPYVAELVAADKAKTGAQMVDKKGNTKLRFDPKRFGYARFQSIVNPGVYKKEELTPEQAAFLEVPANKASLEQSLKGLQEVLSATREKVTGK